MRLLLAAVLIAAALSAQPASRGHEEHETKGPPGKATVMTGCLTQDQSGSFVLTQSDSGVRYTVTGPTALAKQMNQKVKLTGVMHYDTAGHDILEVSGIERVAATCSK
jgi:hypothetical protein